MNSASPLVNRPKRKFLNDEDMSRLKTFYNNNNSVKGMAMNDIAELLSDSHSFLKIRCHSENRYGNVIYGYAVEACNLLENMPYTSGDKWELLFLKSAISENLFKKSFSPKWGVTTIDNNFQKVDLLSGNDPRRDCDSYKVMAITSRDLAKNNSDVEFLEIHYGSELGMSKVTNYVMTQLRCKSYAARASKKAFFKSKNRFYLEQSLLLYEDLSNIPESHSNLEVNFINDSLKTLRNPSTRKKSLFHEPFVMQEKIDVLKKKYC